MSHGVVVVASFGEYQVWSDRNGGHFIVDVNGERVDPDDALVLEALRAAYPDYDPPPT